jgi:hypothetical protein
MWHQSQFVSPSLSVSSPLLFNFCGLTTSYIDVMGSAINADLALLYIFLARIWLGEIDDLIIHKSKVPWVECIQTKSKSLTAT